MFFLKSPYLDNMFQCKNIAGFLYFSTFPTDVRPVTKFAKCSRRMMANVAISQHGKPKNEKPHTVGFDFSKSSHWGEMGIGFRILTSRRVVVEDKCESG